MELIIVLALLAMVVALVSPSLSRFSQSIELKTAVQRVSGILRQCRNDAIQKGKIQKVVLDAEKREVRVHTIDPAEIPEGEEPQAIAEPPPEKKYVLPPGILIEEVRVPSPQSPSAVPAIEFYPNGGSSGGAFSLDREHEKGYRIRVNFLTGMVEVKGS